MDFDSNKIFEVDSPLLIRQHQNPYDNYYVLTSDVIFFTVKFYMYNLRVFILLTSYRHCKYFVKFY